jgi:NitT/TauT family transport system substrate-binding protein
MPNSERSSQPMVFRSGVLSMTAAAAALAVAAPARSQTANTLTVALTTRSASDWGLEVAQRQGMFAANGVGVDTVIAGSSAGAAQQLVAGSADLASVSTTQLVQAVEGGAAIVDVFRQVTTTPYTIFGRKGMSSIAQLRGKTIMVGGPNDITRVFMDKILAVHGVGPDEYTYTFAGGPAERYAALVNGAVDATLFNPPVTFRAIDDGYPILDEVTKYFARFPTNGYAVRVDWARTHRTQLVAFMRGFQLGVRWLYDPANKVRAAQILQESANLSPEIALRTYDLFVQRGHLLSVTGRFERDDFAQVIDALVKTKQLSAPGPAATNFYDNGYIDAAMRSLR